MAIAMFDISSNLQEERPLATRGLFVHFECIGCFCRCILNFIVRGNNEIFRKIVLLYSTEHFHFLAALGTKSIPNITMPIEHFLLFVDLSNPVSPVLFRFL